MRVIEAVGAAVPRLAQAETGEAAGREVGGSEPMLAGPRLAALARELLGSRGQGLVPQLSRYTVVSVVALSLDFLLFLALTHAGELKAAAAGVIGYSAGLVLHFVLSTRYVFDVAGAKSQARLFGEFVASGLVGLALTWGVIALATDVGHLPPVVGKAGAVAASFAAVFVLRRSVVFARSAQCAQP